MPDKQSSAANNADSNKAHAYSRRLAIVICVYIYAFIQVYVTIMSNVSCIHTYNIRN